MEAMVIDHQQAINGMMAERYLLGELTDSDLAAFEGHMFDCSTCFEQVRAGTEFVNHLKQMGAEAPLASGPRQGWRGVLGQVARPAPAFAFFACLLAAVSLYQMTMISSLKAPQAESRYMLAGAARDKAADVILVPRNSRVMLVTEYEPDLKFVSYETQIVSKDEKYKAVSPFAGSPAQEVALSFYAGALKPGAYFLLVVGTDRNGTRQELARRPFSLQFLD